MRVEGYGQFGRAGAGAVVLLALTLCGCGSSSDFFSKSPLNVFNSSSSTAPASGPVAGVGDPANPSTPDVDCPGVAVRNGASTLIIGSKPGETEPAALDVRYQGSIVRTARECHVVLGTMTMKVGIEGRMITGPTGVPGTVDVPLRVAVVQEGVNPKTIYSSLSRVQVSVANAVDSVPFTLVVSDISYPLPVPLALIDNYVVYVGFDPYGAQPEKRKPRHPTRRSRARARPKVSENPPPQR
jgi:hypothetical protein